MVAEIRTYQYLPEFSFSRRVATEEEKAAEVAKRRADFHQVVGEMIGPGRPVSRPLVPELENWGKTQGKLLVAAPSPSPAPAPSPSSAVV